LARSEGEIGKTGYTAVPAGWSVWKKSRPELADVETVCVCVFHSVGWSHSPGNEITFGTSEPVGVKFESSCCPEVRVADNVRQRRSTGWDDRLKIWRR